MPPVAAELTGSWLRRMALASGLPAQDLVRGILNGSQTVQITGTPKTALEAYLNAPARSALARFTRVPQSRLYELLPQLGPTHPRLSDDGGPQAAWFTPAHAWVTACPQCTARAWSRRQPVLLYPGSVGHICRRHRRWLLANAHGPASVPLGILPEVMAAHRRHVALVRGVAGAAGAVAVAAAMVWSWLAQQWWIGDKLWSRRAAALASLTGCPAVSVAAHALIAYPETISVAALLSNPQWQQRLRQSASDDGLRAAKAMALEDIGRWIGRPWLVDWLTADARTRRPGAEERDPLQWWLGQLTGPNPSPGDLWCVPDSLARPVHYGDRLTFLTDLRVREVIDGAKAACLTGGWEPVPHRPSPAGPHHSSR
ncbi:TniQ family protein [Streptomyces filamentosus]|uniref:TniQ family protein n=1 Tax=Streptomyces filamentosus TaxID=67294 RepID=UPI0033CDEB29